MMNLVCSTKTSATIRWSLNAVPLPCFAECGWGGCNGHTNRNWGQRRQFIFSNPWIHSLAIESAHSPFSYTGRGGVFGSQHVAKIMVQNTVWAPSWPKWPEMGISGTFLQKLVDTTKFSIKFYLSNVNTKRVNTIFHWLSPPKIQLTRQ